MNLNPPLKLVAYSQQHNYIQVSINGSLYEYRISGNIQALVEQIQHLLRVKAPTADVIRLLMQHRSKGTKSLVDFLDADELHR